MKVKRGEWNGQALKLRRAEKGWSQGHLSRTTASPLGGHAIGIDRISRYEHGWATPNESTAKRLAEALGCPLAALYRKARVQ